MTRYTYYKTHGDYRKGKHEYNKVVETHPGYTPKHEKQLYNVWRVLGPAGPAELILVYGIEEARQSVVGCWDWEVSCNGKVVKI